MWGGRRKESWGAAMTRLWPVCHERQLRIVFRVIHSCHPPSWWLGSKRCMQCLRIVRPVQVLTLALAQLPTPHQMAAITVMVPSPEHYPYPTYGTDSSSHVYQSRLSSGCKLLMLGASLASVRTPALRPSHLRSHICHPCSLS